MEFLDYKLPFYGIYLINIKNTIVGFLNSNGGRIFIGIDIDDKVIGL